MPCPPDRRELKSSELDDKVCDLRALHHQCTEMIGSLHLLAHRGGPPIPTALQGLIPPLGALSDAADGCEPLGLREAEKRIRSAKRQLASLEVVCCRLGTALAKAAHPEDLAVLSASERDRVTGCLAYHREHREEDRGVVVRRAIREGHYRRAVMATSISVERLMTVRSCLNRSSLDRAIARLAGEASARFVLEVARLEGLHEARRQAEGQARARVAAETPEWLDKEQARAHSCPVCGCMRPIRTHRTDLKSRPGWVEDLYGPGYDLEVAAACAVCDWHDVQQGGQER